MSEDLHAKISKEVLDYIANLISSRDVVLFMKGSPGFPRCRFSSDVIKILDECSISYAHVDVLEDPEIREGIKVHSSWPTIPQLYFMGKFIGGRDIITDLHARGEFKTLLKDLHTSPENPK